MVEALNQKERQPMPVAEQVASIYAGTGGYLDRIKTERVAEFLGNLISRLHADNQDLLDRINESGELSDEDEEALGKAIAQAIDDFGPDFDQEGNPLEEGESDRIRDEQERERPRRTDGAGADEAEASTQAEQEEAGAAASGARSRLGAPDLPMATRKEVKNRISSVKNVQKITRAMEMVAAARLRRAEQRIDHLRPYARELRKMTRQVAEAAGVGGAQPARPPGARGGAHGRASCWSPATAASPARSTRRSSAPASSFSASCRRHGQGGPLLGRRTPRRLDHALPRRGAARRVRRASPTGRRSRTRARSPRSWSPPMSTRS